jgi:DNA end-binding protein Ku
MAPRANWKGYLRLSLVSCPIALYPATTEREKVRFHQINAKSGNRIRYKKVDADSGREVEADDIVKGFEVSKGKYVEVTDDELDAVEIDTARTVDIERFVPREEIDDLYVNRPYYIAPSDKVGAEAFVTIRKAIEATGKVALGRVVLTTREHMMVLEPRGKGLVGLLLRYPYEVRDPQEYFDDIPEVRISKEMLDLAKHIVASKTGHFEPDEFEDRYEEALKDIVKRKAAGEEIKAPERPPASNVINLMDALRESVKAGRGRKGGPHARRPAERRRKTTAHSHRRASKRARKAG